VWSIRWYQFFHFSLALFIHLAYWKNEYHVTTLAATKLYLPGAG